MTLVHYENPQQTTFTGDWMLDLELGPYPGLLAGRWNGWAVPLFTREVAERVVADQEKLRAGDPDVPRLEWDGDVIVLTDPQYPDEPTRVEPTADGEYDMGLGWCWDVADDGFKDPSGASDEQIEAVQHLRRIGALRRGDLLTTLTVKEDGTHELKFWRTQDEGEAPAVTVSRDGGVTIKGGLPK